MSALTRMNVLKKPQLSYVLEKEDSCVFALLLKAFIYRLRDSDGFSAPVGMERQKF
ncbi:hypothetical protein HanIR_Chr05g0245161 [Helianthus annuus]|nr:hypothetical protein HanIR_Chr05g0245161 [Helianthus annuus]